MTEPHGEEEARDCRGLAEEEEVAVAVPEEEEEQQGEEEEEQGEQEEDLRGASSAAEEGAEVGEADTSAPSPGELTWALTAAFRGNTRTNQDTMSAVSMETGQDDVATIMCDLQTFFLSCFMFCNELYSENKGHSCRVSNVCVFSKVHVVTMVTWLLVPE